MKRNLVLPLALATVVACHAAPASAEPATATARNFVTTFSDDTRATELPAGWGGYGAEDAFANPMLPAGLSFADVVAGADEVAFTTLVPGWAFGFTNFDVAVDNLAVRPLARR